MKHHHAHHPRRGTSATAVHAPGWVEGIAALSDTSPATALMVRGRGGWGWRGGGGAFGGLCRAAGPEVT